MITSVFLPQEQRSKRSLEKRCIEAEGFVLAIDVNTRMSTILNEGFAI